MKPKCIFLLKLLCLHFQKMNATLHAKLSIPLSVSFVLLSDNCVNLENDTSDENRSLKLPCQV